jgi:hypothetical protein
MTTTNKLPETQRLRRGHKFYPTTAAKVPALYSTEDTKAADKVIRAHYFVGGCDWWVAEWNPADGDAFGFVCLGDPQSAEWGYFDLTELEALKYAWMVVERDMHWAPRPFAQVWDR